MVGGVELIKRGDQNNSQPLAIGYFNGRPGQTLTPPLNQDGLNWYGKNNGIATGGTVTKEIAELSLDGTATTVSNSRLFNNLAGIQCDSTNAIIKNNTISSNGTGIIWNYSKEKVYLMLEETCPG